MAKPLYVYKGGAGSGTAFLVYPDDKAYVDLRVHYFLTGDKARYKTPYNLLKHMHLSNFDKNAIKPLDIDMGCLEYLDFFAISNPGNGFTFDAVYDEIIILGPTGEEKIVYKRDQDIRPVDDDIYNKLMEILMCLN